MFVHAVDLRVNALMSLFRILLAMNLVNLTLDTVGSSVNTALIIMDFQLNHLFRMIVNKF